MWICILLVEQVWCVWILKDSTTITTTAIATTEDTGPDSRHFPVNFRFIQNWGRNKPEQFHRPPSQESCLGKSLCGKGNANNFEWCFHEFSLDIFQLKCLLAFQHFMSGQLDTQSSVKERLLSSYSIKEKSISVAENW